MFASAVVYSGLVVAFGGIVQMLRGKRRAWAIVAAGVIMAVVGLLLPAAESRIVRRETRLDEFAPAWQFHEVHSMRIDAPAERVYAAIRDIRADEIRLFGLLTWIRRGGRDLPESVLHPGDRPLIEVATRSGFIYLADDPPREVVIGTIIARPRRARDPLTPELFRAQLRPGYILASMNFVVHPLGPDASLVTTETRVFANSERSRRRFGVYWRVIYPGSALIRRMWLRAIARRAESGA
jgi:hypothetical protein